MNERMNDQNDDRLRDALRSTYETPEPSEALQQRVAWLAERQDRELMVPSRRVIRLRAAFAAGMLVLVLAGAMAFRYLFYRPGESAIQMIPADAISVITIDLQPSPMQVPVFKRISDA